MAFVKRPTTKIKNTVTFQMAISEHLKPNFMLRSMPQEPLDNASNSFPPKLKILDRNFSSQNMRGQTAHNRCYSGNPLGEKKTSILVVCSNSHFKNQVSGIPWPICCPVMSIWMGLNRYFHPFFTWWNCPSLYLQVLKNIKNVKGCRDGMPKSIQTR